MIDIAIGFGIICSSDESELDPLLPLFYLFLPCWVTSMALH
jgi:hypothetical protein